METRFIKVDFIEHSEQHRHLADIKKQGRRKKRSSPKANAAKITPKLISDLKQNNRALTQDFNAPRHGLGTYANPAENLYGAKGAIIKALKNCHAIFEKGVENTSERNVAIGASLFADEVIQQVKSIAGADCFADSTIICNVDMWMPEDGTVGVIILSKDEDQPRHCWKPRHKYYLIKK
jgi:hypothetical protein